MILPTAPVQDPTTESSQPTSYNSKYCTWTNYYVHSLGYTAISETGAGDIAQPQEEQPSNSGETNIRSRQAHPRSMWRAIVDALKSPVVGLTALARRVEAAHFRDSTETLETPALLGKSIIGLLN